MGWLVGVICNTDNVSKVDELRASPTTYCRAGSMARKLQKLMSSWAFLGQLLLVSSLFSHNDDILIGKCAENPDTSFPKWDDVNGGLSPPDLTRYSLITHIKLDR